MTGRRRKAAEGELSSGAAEQQRTAAIERGAGGTPLRDGPPLTLGTAGHIDHGKTALITRLTGKNTDRLREERSVASPSSSATRSSSCPRARG